MLERWKICWQFQYHEGYGFTLLTPLFGLEIYLKSIPCYTKRTWWKGWRLLIWPILRPFPKEGDMLMFWKGFERVEEINVRA